MTGRLIELELSIDSEARRLVANRDADALVKDYEGKQFSLESSLLEGFSVGSFRAAAAAIAAAWSLEVKGKVVRPEQLALVPSPRRSLPAARATVLSAMATLGLGMSSSWGSLRPNPAWDNTGAELADTSVRLRILELAVSHSVDYSWYRWPWNICFSSPKW